VLGFSLSIDDLLDRVCTASVRIMELLGQMPDESIDTRNR